MLQRGFVQQLVSQCDIEDIMSSYVTLKRMGRNLKCSCPFHSEKTPSLVVYSDSQSFYCFGCGAGGDVISFIMRAENLEYIDAVKLLCSRTGVAFPDDVDDKTSKTKATILEINKEAARFFHKCLKSNIGEAGYAYFKKRELSDKIITTYGLGYAPNSWSDLSDYLRSRGYSIDDMIAAAVVSKGKNGRTYDAFRNRAMFPIIDLRQNVIGFGGRVLDDSKPKYLNSSDTLAFKKSRNLFSLNFAKNEIANSKDRIILAEGYMDVIAIHSAGFKNAVATLGTSLTEEQARLISKYAKEVIIAYDSDGAGQAATMRAINLLSDAGIKSKVLHMEGAKDPDEYIKKFGAKRFELLLDSSTDIIEHELGALQKQCDLETSEGKITYLKRAILVLANIKNPLEREVHIGIVATQSGASAETVKAQTNELIKKKIAKNEKKAWRDIELNTSANRDRINPQKGQYIKEAVAEERILSFLFKNPDYFDYMKKSLDPLDFVTEFNRRVYEAALEALSDGGEISITAVSAGFSHEEISAISAILARNADEPNTKEALEDYIGVLKEYKGRLNPKSLSEVDITDIEEYRQKLKKQKQ